MDVVDDQIIISLSTFICQAFKVRKQTSVPADRQIHSSGTKKIIPILIPVPTIYVLWPGLEGWTVESGLRVSVGCSVGYGIRDFWLAEHDVGLHLYGVFGWRAMCPHFVGTRGVSRGVFVICFLRQTFAKFCEYHVSSVEQTPFFRLSSKT